MLVLVTGLLAVLAGGAIAGAAVLAGQRRALLRRVAALEAVAVARARERASARCDAARLSAALGGLDDGIVIFGADGVSVYHNDPAAKYLDARHGDALVEEAISAMADVGPGTARRREVEVFGPPRRTLVLKAVPLADGAAAAGATDRGDGPVPSGVMIVIEDVTERRRLENVRRDFVANISHELKTPVGALALLAETLMAEDDPDTIQRLAENMVGEAFRVANTIEDLLELSRLEAEGGDLDERVAVATFVDEAVGRVEGAAQRRGIPLQVVDPPPDLSVQGERRQLVSAVANLLDNAVKYSEAGSPVEVRAAAAGNWVEVEVRDHGMGIPRHDLERIFERFYRVDRARSRETGGTGLGLAIVRHVVSNHRGEVRVDSREGEGSRFTLRLPSGSAPSSGSGSRAARATLRPLGHRAGVVRAGAVAGGVVAGGAVEEAS